MQARFWIILMLLATAAAGCLGQPEESTREQGSRQMRVQVPDDATQVHVDVVARATGGEPDVTILIEDEAGANLATETFGVVNTTSHRASAPVSGGQNVTVTVRVVDGDATLDVSIRASVPDRTEPIVLREQRIVIVRAPPPAPSTPAVSPTPTTSPPTPTSPTPASPTPTSPTPPANDTQPSNGSTPTNNSTSP